MFVAQTSVEKEEHLLRFELENGKELKIRKKYTRCIWKNYHDAKFTILCACEASVDIPETMYDLFMGQCFRTSIIRSSRISRLSEVTV